ncbi:MAG: anthranilate synthase component I family protein, partial [Planctomycetota bacterium]
RLAVADPPSGAAIYRCLRRRNPAWYAAYLRLETPAGPRAICSCSPELFLRVRGRQVITRPIKGTRPRTGHAAADRRAAEQLLQSGKDNAELAMIIDLLRNDLGRLCRYGSVRVSQARVLEEHPTVYHLVGTVEGELVDGAGPADLLRATFPGGSITGAPKIRAMEIIDELEPHARGPYTGCIGTVSLTGQAEWNIAIRTIVWSPQTAWLQVGGGIVADSDPQAELDETLDKARAMLEAIELARQEGKT